MFALFFCLLLDSTEEEKYFRACISELTSRTNQSMLPGDCQEYNAAHLYSRLSDNGEFPSFTFSPRKKIIISSSFSDFAYAKKIEWFSFFCCPRNAWIFPLWLLPRNLELRGPRKLIANSRRLIFSSGGGNRERRQQRHYNMISLALNTEWGPRSKRDETKGGETTKL